MGVIVHIAHILILRTMLHFFQLGGDFLLEQKNQPVV